MISILVLSSDGYKDCWDPMFKSLKKYLESIEDFELLLSVNELDYTFEGLDIKILKNGFDTPWSKRVRDSLDRCTHNTVLLLVEDYFLRKKVPSKELIRFARLINDSPDVNHIRLLDYGNKFETSPSEFEDLDRITSKTKNRFMFLPSLWEKEILKKYLVDFEGPYIAEKTADVKARFYKHGFYVISDNYIKAHGHLYKTSSSGGVYKGKWKPWVREFFEELDCDIDLNVRGVGDEQYFSNERIKTIYNQLLKHPMATLKSLLSITSVRIQTLNLK